MAGRHVRQGPYLLPADLLGEHPRLHSVEVIEDGRGVLWGPDLEDSVRFFPEAGTGRAQDLDFMAFGVYLEKVVTPSDV